MPSHFADEPEQIGLLRETLRRFVAAEMPPEKRQQWDREHRFPRELFAKLAALGVCGLTIDEAYGGAGRDLVAAVAVIEEPTRPGSRRKGARAASRLRWRNCSWPRRACRSPSPAGA